MRSTGRQKRRTNTQHEQHGKSFHGNLAAGNFYFPGSISIGPGRSGLSTGLSPFGALILGSSILGGVAGAGLPGASTLAPLSITIEKCACPLITYSVDKTFALELTNIVVFDNPAP